MSTTTLDILRKMRDLVAAGWTQGAAARAEDDSRVIFFSEHAVKFCLMGAYDKADHNVFGVGMTQASAEENRDTRHRVLDVLREQIKSQSERWSFPGESFVHWNDDPDRTQQDVLDVIDAAIAHWNDDPDRTQQDVLDVIDAAIAAESASA